VDEIALGKVFLSVFRFPLSISFHRSSPYSYTTWKINKGPDNGSSSETWSHTIDMKIINSLPNDLFL
jgi:hypothetical protein